MDLVGAIRPQRTLDMLRPANMLAETPLAFELAVQSRRCNAIVTVVVAVMIMVAARPIKALVQKLVRMIVLSDMVYLPGPQCNPHDEMIRLDVEVWGEKPESITATLIRLI